LTDAELEIERIKLELLKVGAARAELEFVIKQRQVEIRRLQEAIGIQQTREIELKSKLEG
jgi:hypothetical protein